MLERRVMELLESEVSSMWSYAYTLATWRSAVSAWVATNCS